MSAGSACGSGPPFESHSKRRRWPTRRCNLRSRFAASASSSSLVPRSSPSSKSRSSSSSGSEAYAPAWLECTADPMYSRPRTIVSTKSEELPCPRDDTSARSQSRGADDSLFFSPTRSPRRPGDRRSAAAQPGESSSDDSSSDEVSSETSSDDEEDVDVVSCFSGASSCFSFGVAARGGAEASAFSSFLAGAAETGSGSDCATRRLDAARSLWRAMVGRPRGAASPALAAAAAAATAISSQSSSS